jgi:hypothetical protein
MNTTRSGCHRPDRWQPMQEKIIGTLIATVAQLTSDATNDFFFVRGRAEQIGDG